MTVKILYGFDTERPFGEVADSPKGGAEREANLELIGNLNDLMDEHRAGRTFFILGDYLNRCVEDVGSEHLRQVFDVSNGLVEIGQHTYSHVIVAPIATRPDRTPVSSEVLKEELGRADNSIRRVLGVERVVGLRTPLGYAHGVLGASTDVLGVLKASGLEYVSSSLRDKDWGINAPLRENGTVRQPSVYGNGLVEMPSHGWQDSAFAGTSSTKGTEGYPTTVDGIFEHYAGLVREADELSEREGRDIFVGMCMHPWAIRRYDSNLEVIRRLLDFAGEKGFESVSYGQAAREIAA